MNNKIIVSHGLRSMSSNLALHFENLREFYGEEAGSLAVEDILASCQFIFSILGYLAGMLRVPTALLSSVLSSVLSNLGFEVDF